MPTASRASSPFWYTFGKDGRFAAGGTLTTYSATNPTLLKPTYSDPACINANDTTLELDELGQPAGWPEIYWDDSEKYFIQIKCRDGTEYTVNNFPFSEGGGGGGSVVGIDYDNKLLDGQFRFWFDSPIVPATDETEIAQFWRFKKSNDSAADRIEFNRFNLGQDNPEATPIYYFRYVCTGAGTGESYKDLFQTMADVRIFEQTPLTFSFEAYSDVPRTVEAIFLQHFGTGGTPSPDVSTNIGSIDLVAGEWDKKTLTFTPPSAAGKSIGTNGDDYVAIIVRFPLDSVCDIHLTNMDLKLGDRALPYQRLTKEQEDAYLLGAMIPDIKDGDHGKAIMVNNKRSYDLMFPVLPSMTVPYLGDAVPSGYEDEWTLGQGQNVNIYQDNKRYQRLFNVIGHRGGHAVWTAEYNADFVTVCHMIPQPVTQASNGTPSPGFTYTQYAVGDTSSYLFDVQRIEETSGLLVKCLQKSQANHPNYSTNGGALAGWRTLISGNVSRYQEVRLEFKDASQMTPGCYFTVSSPEKNYCVYYTIDGAGSAPSLSGFTNLQVSINSSSNAYDVMFRTTHVLAGFQVDSIQCKAASAITAGSYFNLNTYDSGQFYIWFKIGNSGNDPKLSGKTGILVALDASDTANQVAIKLATAIDSTFYKIPDLRGVFLRGYDSSGKVDFDTQDRTFAGPGSLQYDQVISHIHGFNYTSYGSLGSGEGSNPGRWTNTATASGMTDHNKDVNNGGAFAAGEGGFETRSINIAVNYLIKL